MSCGRSDLPAAPPLRHSYATAALQARVPVKVVSERLGRSSVSFTQDTYMYVIPGMDAQGAALAATAIFGAQAQSATSGMAVSPDSPLV
jgi:integrase